MKFAKIYALTLVLSLFGVGYGFSLLATSFPESTGWGSGTGVLCFIALIGVVVSGVAVAVEESKKAHFLAALISAASVAVLLGVVFGALRGTGIL